MTNDEWWLAAYMRLVITKRSDGFLERRGGGVTRSTDETTARSRLYAGLCPAQRHRNLEKQNTAIDII
jgi:hypothetical protein